MIKKKTKHLHMYTHKQKSKCKNKKKKRLLSIEVSCWGHDFLGAITGTRFPQPFTTYVISSQFFEISNLHFLVSKKGTTTGHPSESGWDNEIKQRT